MVVAPPAPTTPPAPAAAAAATRAMMQEMFEGFKSEREAARKEYREDIQDMKNELDAMKAAVMEGRRVAGIAAEKLAASTARQRATEEQLQQERAERGRLQAELDAMRAQAAGRRHSAAAFGPAWYNMGIGAGWGDGAVMGSKWQVRLELPVFATQYYRAS